MRTRPAGFSSTPATRLVENSYATAANCLENTSAGSPLLPRFRIIVRGALPAENRVIRFNCPNCGRPYELAEALAKLPLVCRQCGQRFIPADVPTASPPASSAEPLVLPPLPPLAISPPVLAASPPPKTETAVPPPPLTPTKPPDEPPEDEDILVSKPDSSPDIDFNIGGPTAASLSEVARARPAGLSDANRPRPEGLEKPSAAPDDLGDINLDLLPKARSVPPPPPPAQPLAPHAELETPSAKNDASLLPFIADLVAFLLLVVVGLLLGELIVRKPTGEVLAEVAHPTFPPVNLLLWAAPAVMFALIYILLGRRERTLGGWLRRRRSL